MCPLWCLIFVNPWTVAHQAPLSMGFFRQEYWSGLPFPPSGDFLDPGIEPASPASAALVGEFLTTVPPGKGEGKGTPFQYSCLENSMGGGAL